MNRVLYPLLILILTIGGCDGMNSSRKMEVTELMFLIGRMQTSIERRGGNENADQDLLQFIQNSSYADCVKIINSNEILVNCEALGFFGFFRSIARTDNFYWECGGTPINYFGDLESVVGDCGRKYREIVLQ